MRSVAQHLAERGVELPDPASVYVAPDIDLNRIDPGVVLHPGCRLRGAQTSIGADSELGAESPVTLENCQIGSGVRLKGGFAAGSTLLDGVEVGDGAHLRPGTLLEEQVSAGHTVGLKQTILMPFVTLGSLINFCDCLMAGGTGPHDHGEVGSSYIHFNFTPHQDKATPSLMGDVPHGVLLNQPPVFLGGQGGMVGPRRIAYGTVLAAGQICRQDVTEPGQLVFPRSATGGGPRPTARAFDGRIYGSVGRIVDANVNYLGQLVALEQWYRHVRVVTMGDALASRAACHAGALVRLEEAWAERIERLGQLAEKLHGSVEAAAGGGHDVSTGPFVGQSAFADAWPRLQDRLQSVRGERLECPPPFEFAVPRGGQHVAAVQALSETARHAASQWLARSVECVRSIVL